MKFRTVSIVLIALAELLLAGCSSKGDSAPDQPSASASRGASPLEGTWRTDPITLSDAEATIRKHGLGKYIKKFKSDPPFKGETVLILDLKDEWDLYGQSEGGPREEIDYDADYTVRGNEVEMVHSDGPTVFEWAIEGDTLTLEWKSTTLPGYNGVPDEVYQRALYMTESFTRQE